MKNGAEERFAGMKSFYNSGVTRDINSRIDALNALATAIKTNEKEITEALWKDLHKSTGEAYLTEIGIVLSEIKTQIKNIRRWARPHRVGSPVAIFPSSSRVLYEPKGVVLIIAPWNYPFQLAIDPLVGAIAAGNCVMLKPSTTSAATCAVIKKMLSEVFPDNYVSVFDGDHEQTAHLLKMKFDHIFFTGGSVFGRTVMMEAAMNLVPVTLELGGKSPCIVDRDADIDIAARRVAWGKLINAGQTCIAPDYLFVHKNVKDLFVEKYKENVTRFYGEDIKSGADYPRIISDKAFDRLAAYLSGPGTVIYGNDTDKGERYISPTLMEGVDVNSPLMCEEIFGPILPVMTFEEKSEVTAFVNSRDKPLAFYYFGKKRDAIEILGATTSGGACVNDNIMHIVNGKLPFWGVGMSGMGKYHGKYSFQTFSNARGTVFSKTSMDIKMRYPPYGKIKMLKKIL